MGGAGGCSCRPRHLCGRAAAPSSSSSPSSPSGCGKTTRRPRQEGGFQGISATKSLGPEEQRVIFAIFVKKIFISPSLYNTQYPQQPRSRLAAPRWAPSLYLAFYPTPKTNTFTPRDPWQHFVFIFRRLVTVGEEHEACIPSEGQQLTNSHSHSHTVAVSFSAQEHVSGESQGQRQVMWSHLPGRRSRRVLFRQGVGLIG